MAFFARLDRPVTGEELFDLFTDRVFFIKDHLARYIIVNQTFVDRCGLSDKNSVIGRTAQDIYPGPFGENYYEQDLTILAEGKPVINLLELHLYPRNIQGWCLTNKIPVKDSNGKVIGLTGTSHDVREYSGKNADSLNEISAVMDYIQKNFGFPLKVSDLAEQFNLSLYTLEQKMVWLLNMTPAQFIQKTRLHEATRLLASTDRPLSDISATCGYADQSAFTRMFRQTVGITPSQYRKRHRPNS